jgi:hypothetical protein
MKKNYVLCALMGLFFCGQSVETQAQTTVLTDTTKAPKHWKRGMQTGVNLNQASFSSNWKGGGVNSIAVGLFFNGNANYETTKVSFTNDLQLQYGFLKNDGQTVRKNADRIFLDSKFGYKLNTKWNLYASTNFSSQFDQGFEFSKDANGAEQQKLISRFFAPAYLTNSIGLEYKPVEYFWVRFGTGTLRQTFVTDTTLYRNIPKNYGVEIGKKVRNEAAFQLSSSFDKDIAKNINLKVRYLAFANYETLRSIDNRLDVVIAAKVNKFVSVNLAGTLLYDEDMDYKIQTSQTLAIGILYNFSE